MQSSWAQHSTVVAQRSRAEVGDLFTQHGQGRDVDGRAPLVLLDPDAVWFVARGTVDLFFVDMVDGEPAGRRRHFVRVEAGEIFLGMELLASLSPRLSFGLLAVGSTGTRVVQLDQARLREVAQARHALDAVHGLIDRWVRRISHGLRLEEPPRRPLEALPGTALILEPGQVVTAGPKAVWFVQSEGTSKLSGLTTVRAKARALLPLARESWLQADTRCALHFVDSPTCFRWDPEWQSLRRFHRFVLDALARARLAELRAEATQAALRSAADARELHHTLLGLAALDPEATTAADPGEPTFQAMAVVGRALGLALVRPPQPAPSPSIIDDAPAPAPTAEALKIPHATAVRAVARASLIRTRAVVLPPDIERQSSDPFLGFLGEAWHPVALLPRPSGGYHLVDPARGATPQPLTPALLAQLQPSAFVLYRPFPARPLRTWDLLLFALGGSHRDLLMVLITGGLTGLLGMLIPLAMGHMIDRIIPAAEVTNLLAMGALLSAAAVAIILLQVARGIAILRFELRASSAVEAAVWDRLLALPVSFFRRFSAGDLAVRANGVEAIRSHLSGNVLNALMTSLFSLMNLGVMLTYDVQLTAVAAGLGLVNVLIAAGVSAATMLTRRDLAEIEGRLTSLVLQLLGGVTKLRIAGAEQRAFALWAREFVKKRALSVKARTIENDVEVLNILYPALMMGLVYFMVVRSGRTLSAGDFIGFNAAFAVFVGGLTALVRQGIGLLELIPIVERARPIFQAVPEVDARQSSPGTLLGGIQINHVSFRYSPDGPLILDDVDFDVAPGEFVAIVGSSASGKSTLLRMMLGFEVPLSGGVYYDRHDLRTVDVSEVRRQLGVVLQNGQPIAGDLFENIVGSRNLSHDDAWAAARMAGLEEDIKRMPMQMHTVLGQGGLSLSGGQRQRLLIARALASRPRIVFFDEATSALDNTTQQAVMDNLETQATRVVIAHRLSTVKSADKIIVLERGKVVQVGTYDALMEVEGVFREMARRQIA
jgi:NHLM bacteriocin system ABC transporter ATP-binding protein